MITERHRPSHTTACPWWFVRSFDNPARRLFQDPDRILGEFIRPGQICADIGCGIGYFTIPMARLAGPHGLVTAVDLQPRMLEGVRRRAGRAGLLDRIRLQQAEPADLHLDGMFDAMLAFWMAHEVPDQPSFFRQIHGALKPGGQLLLVEPIGHVGHVAFERTLGVARRAGLAETARPKVRLSRTVVMARARGASRFEPAGQPAGLSQRSQAPEGRGDGMSVLISPAQPGEASVLTSLAHRSKAHWGYPDDLLRLWDADLTLTAEFIRDHAVWSATVDDEIVGFYALVGRGPGVELEHLWVAPPWMGRGVGRALLEHALGQARSLGGSSLRVVSDPHARPFYEHMGARLVGECDSVPTGRRLPVLCVPLGAQPALSPAHGRDWPPQERAPVAGPGCDDAPRGRRLTGDCEEESTMGAGSSSRRCAAVPQEQSGRVRRLRPEDAAAFMSLRREALLEAPFAFGSSPEDDRAASLDFVRDALAGADQAIFGAFAGELVGTVGIRRDGSAKGAHKCDLWGLYVVPGARSAGIGRALVAEALAFARALEGVSHVHVSATERAPRARALYESLGFVTWGIEPAAIRVGGVAVSEHHMALALAGETDQRADRQA